MVNNHSYSEWYVLYWVVCTGNCKMFEDIYRNRRETIKEIYLRFFAAW